MSRCAFLGLGVMGFPMAGHLASEGHEVTVWNRTGAKAQAWAEEHEGEAASDPAGAIEGADFVCLCLDARFCKSVVFDQNQCDP